MSPKVYPNPQPTGADADTDWEHYRDRARSGVFNLVWSYHHNNGTEFMFMEDKRIFHMSLHRHDRVEFYAGTGNPDIVGSGAGQGYNLNIAWNEVSLT